jgi:hypothetical protein
MEVAWRLSVLSPVVHRHLLRSLKSTMHSFYWFKFQLLWQIDLDLVGRCGLLAARTCI